MSETSKEFQENSLDCSDLDRVTGGSFVESFKSAISGGPTEITVNKSLSMDRAFQAFDAYVRG
ncbi:hypothetical protein ACFQZO_13695 [Bradyrhizobium sp. GCM10027634]|uniref:hypothetical protein n=1 Tax=unclassified Bradyrhizobium TaxID=2631580 RepID=UPI00188B4D0E|nr:MULTISPECIES: hypothetical protein [unclassified Bradyrhizobium]MDN5001941.1 hypothetical protein [Bradyrhizobium sp. WYCCWR 12677]QOZ45775.1 hypothetical protein XH89_21525 [Bradyrhizobium sp. CCBAU 53340]